MERLTSLVLRRRRLVLVAWLAVLVPSFVAIAGLSDLLTNRFTLPGTDTARVDRILEQEFGQKTTGAFTLVARGEPGSAERLVPAVQAAAERAAAELPTAKLVAVVPPPSPSSPLRSPRTRSPPTPRVTPTRCARRPATSPARSSS